MNHERYQRWLLASRALLSIEPAIYFTVQALGKLDAKLYEQDMRYREIRIKNDGTEAEWQNINESVTSAYLWVLGSYEVIRTLDQRFREGSAFFQQLRAFSKPTKHQFERVRIPLAKLEAPKSNERAIAHPALTSKHGLGWSLAAGEVVTRTELSEHFLAFLEQVRNEQRDA